MSRTTLFLSFASSRPLFLVMFLFASIPVWVPVAAALITGIPDGAGLFILLLLIVTGRVYVSATMTHRPFFDAYASAVAGVIGSALRLTLTLVTFIGFAIFFAVNGDPAGSVISLASGLFVIAVSWLLRGFRQVGRAWNSRSLLPPAPSTLLYSTAIVILWLYLVFPDDFTAAKSMVLLLVMWLSALRFMKVHESLL